FQPGNRPSCSSVSAVSRANRSLRSFSAIAGGTPLAFPSSCSCLSPLWRKRTSRMSSLQIPSMYGYTVHVKPFGCRGTIPPPDSSRRALPEKVVGGGRAAQGKFGVRVPAQARGPDGGRRRPALRRHQEEERTRRQVREVRRRSEESQDRDSGSAEARGRGARVQPPCWDIA